MTIQEQNEHLEKAMDEAQQRWEYAVKRGTPIEETESLFDEFLKAKDNWEDFFRENIYELTAKKHRS